MPTGYTVGILEGKITSFPQFAKQCMKNFGACIHMRDENMDKEYEPRIPSDYHLKEIKKAKQLLEDSKNLSNKTIISNKKTELEKSKIEYIERIKKVEIDNRTLNNMLKEVKKWIPPTSEHEGLKKFMIDQIVKTIDFDCNIDFYNKVLIETELQLLSLNVLDIRQNMKTKAIKDFEYHTTEYNAEIKRCNGSNQWVSDLLTSL